MDKPKRLSQLPPTSTTLVGRIKFLDDNTSWQDFDAKYRKIILGLAKKLGLTDAEAADAAQETFLAVAKHIGKFEYDSSRSFTAWLLKIARSKITDQFRKRLPVHAGAARQDGDTVRTATVERIPNPTSRGFEAKWDSENREQVQITALEKLRSISKPKHFQIYHALAVKGWPVAKVVATFGVNANQVYKIKERLTEKLRDEAVRLEKNAL